MRWRRASPTSWVLARRVRVGRVESRSRPSNGLKWKRAKGLEPSTYGLGSHAEGHNG